ncbi:isopeptide-forming domain-containing fimbrial protein [Bifidobacterium phasiani]|uniref:Isopeptide-forming domain-containing fimbrial protein n=1 Tax=Bifidobacterium phasiani TaxID=2834431 RepID=A0ABS6W7Y1_9BIFI|nr:isopeptide-forming domain-containing fimbrial protein [Bifidobacterium phasiani]MBW3081857.1 isopeptide-forming domain-containing fimbrial protein [Bifidobacterium phasiani]
MMMKGMLKRCLAGVAAAALAVTGMAAMTGAANAASLELSGDTVGGHTYTAYKIATYDTNKVTFDDDGNLTGIVVDTVTEWEKDAADAVDAARTGATSTDAYAKYGDPVAYAAASFMDRGAELNQFAQYLASHVAGKPVASTQPVSKDDAAVEFADLEEGLYLIVDSNGFPLTIIGTSVTIGGQKYETLGETPLGRAEVKPDTTTQKKTVDKNTVSVGDTVTYTLTATIPEFVTSEYTLSFRDQLGLGQTADLAHLTVTAMGVDAEEGTAATPLTRDDNASPEAGTYSVLMNNQTAENTLEGSDIAQFEVRLNQPSEHANTIITVTYTATVTQNAPYAEGTLNQMVHNRLVDENGTTIPGTETTVHLYGFEFTKTNKGGVLLPGAGFKIKNEQGQWLKYEESTGAWAVAKDANEDGETEDDATEFFGNGGNYSFKGLAAGKYTVVETTVPTGYMQSVKPEFTVTLGESGPSFQGAGKWADLVVTSESGTTVMNAKNVTELPITGAAGITMFVVLGLLIAGAGIAVYMKSRGVRNMMRA